MHCFRPAAHCLCGFIAPFDAHCDVLILQHPHERKKYYGTAKLVRRFVRNSDLRRGVEFESSELSEFFGDRRVHLLFPAPSATSADAYPLGSNDAILVIDGTWSEARKLLRLNPSLSTLPKLTFPSSLESRYLIRKQPRAGYLSTLESVAHFLLMNASTSVSEEQRRSYAGLMTVFEEMVERQLQFFPRMRQAKLGSL